MLAQLFKLCFCCKSLPQLHPSLCCIQASTRFAPAQNCDPRSTRLQQVTSSSHLLRLRHSGPPTSSVRTDLRRGGRGPSASRATRVTWQHETSSFDIKPTTLRTLRRTGVGKQVPLMGRARLTGIALQSVKLRKESLLLLIPHLVQLLGVGEHEGHQPDLVVRRASRELRVSTLDTAVVAAHDLAPLAPDLHAAHKWVFSWYCPARVCECIRQGIVDKLDTTGDRLILCAKLLNGA